MRGAAVLPVVLFLAGGALIAVAALTGGASGGFVVIVPFLVGNSAAFVLGILLCIAGFFTLPLLVSADDDDGITPGSTPPGGRLSTERGGVLIVGPVPIFFGSWRRLSTRARALVSAIAIALFVLVVLVFLVAIR